jgi:hypothetical protein
MATEPRSDHPADHPGDHPGHAPESGGSSRFPTNPEHPEVRFEPRDIPFWSILIVAVVSCAIGAGLLVGVRALYWQVVATRRPTGTVTFPSLHSPSADLPPEPRLEQIDRLAKTPASNVSKWEKGEEKQLETYGPADEKGFVHIPLERAMDLLAGHLPARKTSAEPKFPDRGLVDDGASNSGRMFRGGQP